MGNRSLHYHVKTHSHTLHACAVQVYDVAWCPSNSTVFAAVTADGRLELWDFAVSTLRPVCQHAVTRTMTCLLFAQVSEALVDCMVCFDCRTPPPQVH